MATQSPMPLAARDKVIDFGKHKGKMLGTLPSSYLNWVSKNLRARDFEEWAKLADQVLQDPVYRDRIEWEYAENLLNGNQVKTFSSSSSPVAELVEISERFGWDNNDEEGWSRIDFELLGTSKGGRIPRKLDGNGGGREERDGVGVVDKAKKTKKNFLSETEDSGGKRRRERRQRMLKKKEAVMEWRGDKMGINEKLKAKFVDGVETDTDGDEKNAEKEDDDDGDGDKDRIVENYYNPFPGREALLRKVVLLNRHRMQ